MLHGLCCKRASVRGRYKNLLATLTFTTIFFIALNELLISELNFVPQRNDGRTGHKTASFKTVFEVSSVVRRSPKILLYTNFFGGMGWYEESKNVYKNMCPSSCTITNNRSEIASADAVAFHLSDIAWQSTLMSGFRFPFPEYRHPDQVWILFNLEPLTMIWGDMGQWQGNFNWTWSYTRNSDVYSPYGTYGVFNYSQTLKRRRDVLNHDYFGAKKVDGGIAMISHCTDEARRYRIIQKLREYIPVRVIGRCGEGCPDGYLSCNNQLHNNKFYLAFENSDCVDYVSEKYWRALERQQIPIVAWKVNQEDIAIPGSYINVYDFPDLDVAGRHIQEVNRNRTLYNSYFKWRLTHYVTWKSGFCDLCHKLQDGTIPRQTYHDMKGWIMNNTCKPVTIGRYIRRVFDRFTYDFRIH